MTSKENGPKDQNESKVVSIRPACIPTVQSTTIEYPEIPSFVDVSEQAPGELGFLIADLHGGEVFLNMEQMRALTKWFQAADLDGGGE